MSSPHSHDYPRLKAVDEPTSERSGNSNRKYDRARHPRNLRVTPSKGLEQRPEENGCASSASRPTKRVSPRRTEAWRRVLSGPNPLTSYTATSSLSPLTR